MVLAYEQSTQTTNYYPIEAVLKHDDPVTIQLTINDEQVETTPEHPFFTNEHGWVAAGKLWIGAHIRNADGSYGTVDSIKVDRHDQAMFNLTVARAHTFFVGAGKWLVHNLCDDDIVTHARQRAESIAKEKYKDIYRKPSAIAVLTGDGYQYNGQSSHGDTVNEIFYELAEGYPNPFDFKCAEVHCINQALRDGRSLQSLQGSQITTVMIRGPLEKPTFEFQPPCPACAIILNKLGIQVIH